tara:strand:+ start:2923 stop:3888 length:966 start_codon:yes stop_codon:yes gene_type:complete
MNDIKKVKLYINHMDSSSNNVDSSSNNIDFTDRTPHEIIERLINRLNYSPSEHSRVADRLVERDNRQSPIQSDEEKTEEQQETAKEQENRCCICYESKSDLETIVSECGHVHCSTCFFEWLKTSRTCSMCRNDFGRWDNLNDDVIENMLTTVQKKYKKKKKEYCRIVHKIIHLEKKIENHKSKNLQLMKQQIRLNELINYTKGYHKALKDGNKQTSPLPCQGEYRRGYMEGMYKYNRSLKNDIEDMFGELTCKPSNSKKNIKLIKREVKSDTTSDSDESNESMEENTVLPTTNFDSDTVEMPNTQGNPTSSPVFIFRGSEQ